MLRKALVKICSVLGKNLSLYGICGLVQGGLTHIILITPVMNVLFNGTPHSHKKLNLFIYKIFRRVHLCNVVNVHECSINFHII